MSDSGEEDNTQCRTFITKGGIKIFLDGFTYEKNKVCGENYYWRCELKKDKLYGCNATIKTKLHEDNNDEHILFSTKPSHNHEPESHRMSIATIKNEMKMVCSQSTKKTCNIVQDIIGNCDELEINYLPSVSAMKQCVYREKRKYNKQIEPLDVYFKVNTDLIKIYDELFLIKDMKYDDTKRIMLFSTRSLIKNLSESSYWILDGTFKIVPTLFLQLYTIYGNIPIHKHKTFPMVFALCTHKDKKSYDKLFELLIEYASENEIHLQPMLQILEKEIRNYRF